MAGARVTGDGAAATPRWLRVLLCGWAGGFDFVHGLLLYPELERLGERVWIARHSFGDVDELEGTAHVVFEEEPAVVKRVTASTRHSASYAPEVHLRSFLDARFQGADGHTGRRT